MNRTQEPTLGAIEEIDLSHAAKVERSESQAQRRPWLALLLGFCLPTVAFAYVGRLGLGLTVAAAVPVLILMFGQTGLIQSVPGIWTFYGLGMALVLLQIVYPWRAARAQRNVYAMRWYNRWYIYVLLAVFISVPSGLLLENRDVLFGYATYRIPSLSMTPALEHGDFIVVDTRPKARANLGRNDIIVYREGKEGGETWVRRIIGLPGETIAIDDRGLHVDGILLEGFQAHARVQIPGKPMKPLTLRPDEYFLLGDNLEHSLDSRYRGPYFRDDILGVVNTIYFSPDFRRIGRLH